MLKIARPPLLQLFNSDVNLNLWSKRNYRFTLRQSCCQLGILSECISILDGIDSACRSFQHKRFYQTFVDTILIKALGGIKVSYVKLIESLIFGFDGLTLHQLVNKIIKVFEFPCFAH